MEGERRHVALEAATFLLPPELNEMETRFRMAVAAAGQSGRFERLLLQRLADSMGPGRMHAKCQKSLFRQDWVLPYRPVYARKTVVPSAA